MLKQNKTKQNKETVDNSIFHDGVRLPDCQAEEIECINLTRTERFQRAGGEGEGGGGCRWGTCPLGPVEPDK